MSILKLIFYLARISGQVRFSHSSLAVIMIAGLVAGVANTGLVALTSRILNREEFSSGMGWAFLALCLALPIGRFVSRAVLISLTQNSLNDLRMRMCRRILSSPLRQMEQLGLPRLQSALIYDLSRITDALGLIPELLLHSVVVLGCLIYLGFLSWPLLLALLGLMAIGVTTYQLPMLQALRSQKIARDQWDEVFDDVRGVTQGAKELKMHRGRREGFLLHELGTSTEGLKHHSIRAGVLFSAATSWGQVLFFVAIGSLLFLGPTWIPLERGVLTGFVLVIVYLMSPLEVILGIIPQISSAQISVNNIESLGLSLSSQPAEADAPQEESAQWERIDLQRVTHSYRREGEEESFLLGPIDLTVRPGEMIFLTGGNGSGKTTLAKILLGLYSPESGEVLLNGAPLDDSNRDAYRQLFSVVFADYFLFRRLVGGDHSELDGQALHYLTRLELQQKVTVLGGELSSLDLSQGQRKRLALLTAYLEDRPIYLFDEWASDQDPAFKEIFYHELLSELKARGKTVIAVSHDDHFYGVADRIVKLTDGVVEHDGPASSLLAPAVRVVSDPARRSLSHG